MIKMRRHPGDVLADLMNRAGLNETELARLSGVRQPTIHRIKNKISGEPKNSSLEPLARFFKITLAQMRGEIPLNDIAAESAAIYNVETGPPIRGVPLISWMQAAMLKKVDAIAGENIFTSKKVGPKAYALIVRDDSMENPGGGPSFPQGAAIIVDPDVPHDHQKFVIAVLPGDDRPTFKQLIIDGRRQFLKPLNPRYPILEVPVNTRFSGVVVQTIIDND